MNEQWTHTHTRIVHPIRGSQMINEYRTKIRTTEKKRNEKQNQRDKPQWHLEEEEEEVTIMWRRISNYIYGVYTVTQNGERSGKGDGTFDKKQNKVPIMIDAIILNRREKCQ